MFYLDSTSIQRHLLDILRGCFTSSPFIIPHYVHKRHGRCSLSLFYPLLSHPFFLMGSKWIVESLSKQAEFHSVALQEELTQRMWATGVLDYLQPESIATQLYSKYPTQHFENGSLYSGSILRLCNHRSYFDSVMIFFTVGHSVKPFQNSILYCISLFSLSHGSSMLPWHSNGWQFEHSPVKCGVCPLRHKQPWKPALPPYVWVV